MVRIMFVISIRVVVNIEWVCLSFVVMVGFLVVVWVGWVVVCWVVVWVVLVGMDSVDCWDCW